MNIYESAEDYLERILILENTIKNVRSIDIVNDMGFSKPSVSIAMKKLSGDGYIEIGEKGFIVLTAKGREIATKIYERHQVLTEWLMKHGVSKEIAMKDACKVEHDLSNESYEAIKKSLGK